MGPIYLFDLASQQANWLSVRQATIARNVANVNTPGYTTLDIQPFQEVMSKTALRMSATSVRHISIGDVDLASGTASKEAKPSDVTGSGNSVSVEQELMKSGEVNRGFSLNTSLVKAFNRMLLESVKV